MSITYSVSACNAGQSSPTQNKCTVNVRATAFGNRPVTDLQWQLNGTAANKWTDMQTSNAIVDAIPKNQTGSGTIFFRIKVSYANYPPNQTYTPTVVVTLIQ